MTDDIGVQSSKITEEMIASSDFSLKWWDRAHGYKVEEVFHSCDDMMLRLAELVKENEDLQVVEFKVGNRRASLMWYEREELP